MTPQQNEPTSGVTRLYVDGVDLVIELGQNNANRSCQFDCDREASHYVLSWGVYSGYCCADHLDDAIEAARRTPEGQGGRNGLQS